MAKANKSCRVCSIAYKYCHSCDYNEPAYKQFVCSENCYKIWNTLSRNGVGLATTQETLEALELIPMPSFLQPGIRSHINRLFAETRLAVDEVIPVVGIDDEKSVTHGNKNKVVEPIQETIEVVLKDEV